MKKVAITGNMGSGKTIAVRIFESMGIPVFYADAEAKKLYSQPFIISKIKTLFGQAVFDGDIISFPKLAAIVFNDSASLSKLESVIHPEVINMFNQWIEKFQKVPYVMMESAIIFEKQLEKHFDTIIIVTCPIEICISRIMQRDSISRKDVMGRMKNQWDEAKKVKKAHHVIVNDGENALLPQVFELHKTLSND